MTGLKRKPKGGARAIGTYVAKALDPAARARGFATTALLSDWPSIAGQELARFTMPDRAADHLVHMRAVEREALRQARQRRGQQIEIREFGIGRVRPAERDSDPA